MPTLSHRDAVNRAFYRDYGCTPKEAKDLAQRLGFTRATVGAFDSFSGDLSVWLAPLDGYGHLFDSKTPTNIRLTLPRLAAIENELASEERKATQHGLGTMRAMTTARSILRILLSEEAPAFNFDRVPDRFLHTLIPDIVALRGSSYYVAGKTRAEVTLRTYQAIQRLSLEPK